MLWDEVSCGQLTEQLCNVAVASCSFWAFLLSNLLPNCHQNLAASILGST